MTALADVLASATATLRTAHIESPRLEARILAARVLGVAPEEVLAHRDEPSPEQIYRFEGLVDRRVAGEPIAYIIGKKEFFGLEFEVGPGALVPRPETETLVEQALREFPGTDSTLRILDLGTGTGCLLISFLSLRPGASGVGIDRSVDALKWAARNLLRHNLGARCELLRADWNEGVPGEYEYDVIFANPPYIASGELGQLPTDIRVFEPALALVGGPDGLDAYRQIAPILQRRLRQKGLAFLEIGRGQHHVLERVLTSAGLHVVRAVNDLAGIPRCLVVRGGCWNDQKKGWKR